MSEAEDLFIDSDENKLRQVLSNFVNNALKFTERGLVGIGINLRGDFVEFHIRDTGIGIPHQFQEKIFDRFC